MPNINAQFPPKLQGLFNPMRYKVAYGGRGSGKSWAFARALLIQAAQSPKRVLCAREVQKSIKQSVHALLNDQIQALGLGQFYQVLETEIRGINGSHFSFAGLASHTVESIKSFEGCDVVWIDEAQPVSKKSWDILIPTIRKHNSEIWASFNPDLDIDDTYTRFVENTPPNTWITSINYNDNPWFPEVLEKERLHCLRTMPLDYGNIWEGKCKPAVDGAIYANEVQSAQAEGRVCNVPYDPMLKVQVVFDLGWNDAMFISLVQKGVSDLRVIEAIEDSHKTLADYSAMLKEKGLNWGKVFLPHDGAAKDFKTGKSSQEIMTALGWDVEIISISSIEEGIKQSRMTFNRVYFDKTKAKPLIDSLKRYKRQITTTTNEPAAPLHDKASHGADCFRYICTAAERMRNSNAKPRRLNNDNWRVA
jgi:phage terminase large subunit